MEFADLDEKVAFEFWRKSPALTAADLALTTNDGVSLKLARQALQVSTGEMAKRLEMTRAGYSLLETRFDHGEITLNKLKQAADALGCECVVIIRPAEKRRFAESLWKPLYEATLRQPWVERCTNHRRHQVLVAAVNSLALDKRFRRRMRWTQRPR